VFSWNWLSPIRLRLALPKSRTGLSGVTAVVGSVTHAVEKVQMQVPPQTKSVQSKEKSFGAVVPAHPVLVSPLLTVPQPEPFLRP
jgi:hypothetical protein